MMAIVVADVVPTMVRTDYGACDAADHRSWRTGDHRARASADRRAGQGAGLGDGRAGENGQDGR